MRKQQEIDQAIRLLEQYGGEWNHVQRSILETKQNETQVFEGYIKNVYEEENNEALYYAARDAARWLSGKLGLYELIPDLSTEALDKDEWEVCKRQAAEVKAQAEAKAQAGAKARIQAKVKAKPRTLELPAPTRNDYNKLLERIDRLERHLGLQAAAQPIAKSKASRTLKNKKQ